MSRRAPVRDEDALWYKDAVIYEVHVRAFFDSNGDGAGDFKGLTEKLDYLQDLGITAIWLLPFYPSPLRDDGYDTADYTNVHPAYGTLRDFRLFLREAHKRGLHVINELVLNHTSNEHPWFQRSRRAAPGSRFRDFYVWSDTPDRYQDARIIFQDFEPSNWTWDPVAGAYYWHRFYNHQPDLNLDNAATRKALMRSVDFWMEMGIDGMRLDAVPYLYERDGTNCENLPETHDFLRSLRSHIDENYQNRMLLAEANQWPEDAVAYFGEGDECHMAFHFPVMPRLFMAIRSEDRYPIIEILQQTPAIPEEAQWALFLRNHDELTLEMVTDEDRDYMYRVYAGDPQARINLGIRRRLAPLLGNHRRRIELMNGLLFSLPGSPVIYYGDEIGMGDNTYLGDRDGVRTPMQWNGDRNAGFSKANPQRLYLPTIIDPEYHYEALNVEAQQSNTHSLLWWMKRLIALRKRYKAFGRGAIEFLHPDNRKVLAFYRSYEDERILVIANLSRFVQAVELDLSAYRGMVPVEMFGRIEFPAIGELPYFITLGPHTFYWFSLEPAKVPLAESAGPAAPRPEVAVIDGVENLYQGKSRKDIESLLPAYLQEQRWFGGKARKLTGATIRDVISLGGKERSLLLVQAAYTEGDPETYVLCLAAATGARAAQLTAENPTSVIARLRLGEREGVLYEGLGDEAFARSLLAAVSRRRPLRGDGGDLIGTVTTSFTQPGADETNHPRLLSAEQSNSSVVYGDSCVFKLLRRTEEGINPDLELGRYLGEQAGFEHVPPLLGALEYKDVRGRLMTVGTLQGYVSNEGDAWAYSLDTLAQFFDRIAVRQPEDSEADAGQASVLALASSELPRQAHWIGRYLEDARLLGQRTAELHLALGRDTDDKSFTPQPFTDHYRQGLYHAMRAQAGSTLRLLRKQLSRLSTDTTAKAERVLALEEDIRRRFRAIRDQKIEALRIRHHGDYHLGQVLYTGSDFVIIDFEGEPTRPLGERRIKRSPLRDVAGMIRSFHYAAHVALRDYAGRALPADPSKLAPWARFWAGCVSAAFLRSYLDTAGCPAFLPREPEHLGVLLEAYLLEKAVYEISYELNNRPDWVDVPLDGILQMLPEGGE